jgi:transcriptional regulator with XRE-family HTH domain
MSDLKAARTSRGLTQAQVADMFQASQSSVVMWEKGTYQTPAKVLTFFGLSVDRATPRHLVLFRKHYKLSVVQAAEAVGVTAETWRRWEQGLHRIHPSVLSVLRSFSTRPAACTDLLVFRASFKGSPDLSGYLYNHARNGDEWFAWETGKRPPPADLLFRLPQIIEQYGLPFLRWLAPQWPIVRLPQPEFNQFRERSVPKLRTVAHFRDYFRGQVGLSVCQQLLSDVAINPGKYTNELFALMLAIWTDVYGS